MEGAGEGSKAGREQDDAGRRGLPAGLVPLVLEYLEYLHANSLAWRQGRTSFTATFQGVESRVGHLPPATRHLVRCRPCPTAPGAAWSCSGERRSWGLGGSWRRCWRRLASGSLSGGAARWASRVEPLQVECGPEGGLAPPLCRPAPPGAPGDSPKWPLEPLVLRYSYKQLPQANFLAGTLHQSCLC